MKRCIGIWAYHSFFIFFTFCGVDGTDSSSPENSVKPGRPNILWISLEDITPMMGCYGDEYARTPVFDSLATEGIRYTKAHAVAPVCSTSRSSIITGMYPNSLGTLHHRSNTRPPRFAKLFPSLLIEAGYYTSNNSKEDYNMGRITGVDGDGRADAGIEQRNDLIWHESSKQAHWRNRPQKDQPFFAVFNFTECHSSITKYSEDEIVEERLNRLQPGDFHYPEEAPVPAFNPNVPEFRKVWSRYYDAVTQVDYRAGEVIDQLKKDGLWEDTIIFVWADHGVGMPRGKHTLWEQGTHVPLIARFPEKYQHLAPAGPGSVIDGLVTLMDLGPSVLTLAGLDIPEHMHGRPLLCQNGSNEIEYREAVYSMRDRLDSRFEMVRAVRDERYRYQRNFYPHLPFKPYEDYEFGAAVVQEWVELARKGKLTGPLEMLAMRFKPVEELYDSENDPRLIENVIDDPKYAEVVNRMRDRLYQWMVHTRDIAILEETEMLERLEEGESPWDLAQSLDNYERILRTANLQVRGEAAIPDLLTRTKDPDSAIRFWAVLGLVATRSNEAEVIAGLQSALADDSVSVGLTAAEGLFNCGRYEEALPVVIEALNHPIVSAQVRAAGILDTQPPEAVDKLGPAIEPLREAAEKSRVAEMPGIPYGLNYPFQRALKVVSGEENYYRWGSGASGSP